jgi:hypothetical protein
LHHFIHCLFHSTPSSGIPNHPVLFCCWLVGLDLHQWEVHAFCSICRISQIWVRMCIVTNHGLLTSTKAGCCPLSSFLQSSGVPGTLISITGPGPFRRTT